MNTNTIIELSPEGLACGICGVEVSPADIERGGLDIVLSQGQESALRSLERFPADSPGRARGLEAAEFTVKMSRCTACLERRHEAEEMLRRYPSARGRYVQDSLAVPRFEYALMVLAAVDERVELTTSRDVETLVATLVSYGASLTWAARYAPTAAEDAEIGQCAARPFAHLTDRQLGAARAALLTWRVRRVERPVSLLPPVGEACFFCGVGTVTMRPSRRAEAWCTATVRVGNFGGSSDERREVALCGTCHASRREGEALGHGLVDRLVKRASGINRMLGGDRVTTNAYPWGLAGRSNPNTTPWGHIDLEDLRHQVATTSWIGQP